LHPLCPLAAAAISLALTGCVGGSTETHVVAGAIIAGAAVVAAPVTVGVIVAEQIAENPQSNKENTGQPIPEEMKKQYAPDPAENSLLKRQPTYASDARLIPNASYDWLGLNASMFYVFDSGIDLQHHTGWGGSVEGFITFHEGRKSWYSAVSLDLTYLQTEAHVQRYDTRIRETIESYQGHVNLTGGYRIYGFDISSLLGIGLGFTDTSGTRYNHNGAYSSCDALVQAAFRVSYRPTDWCRIFAGYRVFWNIALEHQHYRDKNNQESYRAKSPSLSIQAVEAGVSFLF
jgi:hypothetical protein